MSDKFAIFREVNDVLRGGIKLRPAEVQKRCESEWSLLEVELCLSWMNWMDDLVIDDKTGRYRQSTNRDKQRIAERKERNASTGEPDSLFWKKRADEKGEPE